ncbi:Cypemycin methyltransferase [Caloramator mitchellensis]|uniref:Cypemycin methyltransferase n=1 Tax=Caloramator mitchellensis TaxID=908809 RepID=A0A0R3K4E5_CALMK|nr:class I SAM-dependent methyltransferase [Caloramator mitchellensis]KRQ87215.1 Cypemycin methyltransferase [Caloramator mitchellensis]
MQYIELAQIYDKMIDIDYDSWKRFIEKYMNLNGIDYNGKTVLELACGTGNMTQRLYDMGLKVVALDVSEDMLNFARNKIKNKDVVFINQDMRDLKFDKKFDFIFCHNDGLNYIIEDEELIDIFNRVNNHLNECGLFLFDISSEYKLKKIIGNNSFTLNEDDYCYIWDNYIDDDILDMYITFFVKEGKLFKRIDEHHVQRAHTCDKIVNMLKNTGYKKVEIYDDYSFNNIHNETLRITFVAKK